MIASIILPEPDPSHAERDRERAAQVRAFDAWMRARALMVRLRDRERAAHRAWRRSGSAADLAAWLEADQLDTRALDVLCDVYDRLCDLHGWERARPLLAVASAFHRWGSPADLRAYVARHRPESTEDPR